jgi:hypothetical protein
MPSLEFSSVELLYVAYIASERAIVDFHSRPAALTADSLIAAVFAAAAVEAFTNDLADHVEVRRTSAGDRVFNATTPELIRAAQEMIGEKVHADGHALTGARKRPGGRELQDLRRLMTLRDAILHGRVPRPEPRRGLREVMRHLRRVDRTVPYEGANATVFFELKSPRIAVWAYCTARRIILAMLDCVPPDVEAVSSLRDILRDPIRFPSDRCKGK